MGVPRDLVFPAGSGSGIQLCLTVSISDTPSVEEDETFFVTLNTSSPIVELGTNMTTVTIDDVDRMYSMPLTK